MTGAVATNFVAKGYGRNEEQLWQMFFEDPTVWWDNRTIKTSPRFPDFKHSTTGASLWVNSSSCPKWVSPRLTSLKPDNIGSTAQKKKSAAKNDALTSYFKLRDEGYKLNIGATLSALKVCSASRDLQNGKKIHKHAVDSGDVLNVFVANTLIHMYAKCGSMADARRVFDSMPHRDAVSWTAVVQGYANCGEGDLALQMYAQMQQHCSDWKNRVSILAALKACASLAEKEEGVTVGGKLVKVKSLERIKAVHGDVGLSAEAELDLFVANSLVDVYSKCGSMVDARTVFEKMQQHSVISWNCLIRGYAESGEAEVALDLYAQMQEKGFAADSVTFIAALKACGRLVELEVMDKLRCLEKVRAIHSQACSCGDVRDLVLNNTLVDTYAKSGSLKDARGVFDQMKQRTVVSWTVLILGYAQNGEGEQALELYGRMKKDGQCTASLVTVLAALKACASLADKEAGTVVEGRLMKQECLLKARFIHFDAVRAGVELNQAVANTLVDVYSKCGSLDASYLVFQSMKQHDQVSWNCIMLGYARNRSGELALDLYSRMLEEGCQPDRVTFLAAAKACGCVAETEAAKLVNGRPLKTRSLERGKRIHSAAAAAVPHQKLDVPLLNTLMDMYSKCASMVDARRVFDGLQQRKSVVSWNCIILGYVDNGEPEVAFQLYTRMQEDEKCLPDAVTLVAALKACGCLGALETGRGIQSYARKAGLVSDTMVTNSLVDFFGKCGCMGEAEEVFISVSRKSVVTWAALMTGYSCRGEWERVFELFDRMVEQRLKPDGVMFLTLLTACNHAGLVSKGKALFEEMVVKYGLVPDRQHYGCMVDLLGRVNQLEEAVAMVKRLPFKDDAVIWMVILAAAEKWSDVRVGQFAFQRLQELDARNSSAYVLMSNICFAGGDLN